MNINDLKQQRAIAREQAVISSNKMDMHTRAGNEFSAKVYRARMNALNLYAKVLDEQLKKHTKFAPFENE